MRGLYPENIIAGFIEAVRLGVTGIEMDVVVSKDDKVVVSHEPWMNSDFCLKPDGSPVEKESEKEYNLYKMDYGEIKRFDCGKSGHPSFPLQKRISACKPLLSEVIEAVETFTKQNNLPAVIYNIEIKCEGEAVGAYCPAPGKFVMLVCGVIEAYHISQRIVIKSFSNHILQELYSRNKTINTALLVEDSKSVHEHLNELGFVPAYYNPGFELVSKSLVDILHDFRIKICPWTVNEVSDMEKLLAFDVDGIITDYPDRLIDLLKRK